MFKFFRNLNLSAKFLLFATLVLILIFSGLAVWIYNTDKESTIQSVDNRMYSQLEDLVTLLELEYRAKQQEMESALRVASSRVKALGTIQETEEKVQMVAVNQVTETQKVVEVKKWLLRGSVIQENSKIVDSIAALVGSQVAIFQKIPEGYMRIATTEINPKTNKRLEGFYLPIGNNIVQTIERGQTFKGRISQNNEYFIVAYEPLRIEGEVKGMIYAGVKEKDVTFLRKKFKEKKYYVSGYPFAMHISGEYVIHPILEGKNAEKRFIDYAQKNKRGKYRYRYPNNEEGVWKWTYFTYYEPFELIVGATIDEAQLLDTSLEKVRNTLLIGFILALLMFLLGFGTIVNNIASSIRKIIDNLRLMAEGRKTEKIPVTSQDEIGVMAESLNRLIDGFESYKKFAQSIGKREFEASFEPLSQDDELGNSLLEMRDNLKAATEKEQREKWLTDGFTQFAEILRKDNDNIEALCLNIITNLVKKLNANQGGIFLLKNLNKPSANEESEQYLEMVACYAYDRPKMMRKIVRVGEGLIGQSFQEADILNIREIPQDYIHITSGLGGANPNNILIVPLKTNEITIGVVELASFEIFDELSVEFVEKVSESIAITIFTVTSNLQTQRLLKESRQLTQEMREKEEEMRQNVEELEATQEEMRKNEKELKRVLFDAKNQKEQMDSLINNTEDYIVALDKDYKVMIFNNVARNWHYERTFEKLTIGVSLLGFLQAEEIITFKENYSRALLGERFAVEEKVGEKIYEFRYNPMQDDQGKAIGVSIFGRDITERKLTEQNLHLQLLELQEAEKQLQKQLKNLQDTTEEARKKLFALEQYDKALSESKFVRVEFSLDAIITQVNATFCNLMQFESQELIGKVHKELLEAEEANSPAYLELWRNVRVGISQVVEQKYQDKYGQELILHSHFLPIKNQGGKVLSVLQIGVDITPFKLQEKALQVRIEKLQKEIQKLQNNS
ncbi:MAG: Cache 3/Cache 2 fusion domain-containing protein [Raineya sp.]|nr:Cache 3/Cache 2 fusion domain-containing protein [Raineya sp.]